jgi:hypothetical protein
MEIFAPLTKPLPVTVRIELVPRLTEEGEAPVTFGPTVRLRQEVHVPLPPPESVTVMFRAPTAAAGPTFTGTVSLLALTKVEGLKVIPVPDDVTAAREVKPDPFTVSLVMAPWPSDDGVTEVTVTEAGLTTTVPRMKLWTRQW